MDKQKKYEVKGISKIFLKVIPFFMIISLSLIVYLFSQYFYFNSKNFNDVYSNKDIVVKNIASDIIELPANKDFIVYEGVFAQRDIFKDPFTGKTRRPSVTKTRIAPKKINNDITKKYRVVGIVLDENPKVIIEDLANKETLFLSQGDKLEEAVLDSIQQGKVVFKYNNQHFEMKP